MSDADVAARYDGPERRATMAATDPFTGLPMWVRGIAIVGFPVALSLLLLLGGWTYIPKLQTELTAYRIEAEKNRLAVERQVTQAEQSYRLLQRICSEIAKTEEGRSRCFDR